MEIRQLTTFRILAQTLSFSRTAEALNYVQSTVSTQIVALEEDLGVRLFDRLGKRVALTDAGKRLQFYAERILDEVDEARSAVTDDEELTGTVTIGASESLCTYRLPILLRRFRTLYPQARLIFRPSGGDYLLRQHVSEGLVDVAFTIDDMSPSSALCYEQLCVDSLYILAAPDHPLAIKMRQEAQTALKGEELQNAYFLLTEKGFSYRNILEEALRRHSIDAVADLEFSSVGAIKQCAIAGIGLAFLPEFIVQRELHNGSLVALPWEGNDFSIGTFMLWHQDKWLSPTIRAFIDTARQVLAEEVQREKII